ncbi:MAG TPA: GntR family transcriptional regulator [Thermoanaerobaculia bacterium]|nr:GntR family transcriptional regulator [Thermoanaerobaculia bacterium]
MRALRVDPTESVPIWSQIEEGLRRLVASGALSPGQAVPSVRDLARDLSVNPATVAKAYQRLCEAGVLSVRRGEGTYVSEEPPAMGRGERSRILRQGAARYATLAATAGAGVEEASSELSTAFANLEGKRPPGGKS